MNSAKLGFNPKKHTIYIPVNEGKYVDKDPIVCKSSWEVHFCKWCDSNPNILKWSSESIQIPYYDPIQKKNRRYYPDFSLSVRNTDGRITKYIVELKPYHETIPPTGKGNKKDRTVMYEFCTYQTNIAKWRAAIDFCRKHGFVFKLLTEYDLFKDGKM